MRWCLKPLPAAALSLAELLVAIAVANGLAVASLAFLMQM